MKAPIVCMFLMALLLLAGCSPRAPSHGDDPVAATSVAQPSMAPATFVNRVWVVAESEQVSRGALRVFLSDGTMVMASTHAGPAFGTWRDNDGHLTITEAGQRYKVDILALDQHTFRIRIHSPGEPVVIGFVPATSR